MRKIILPILALFVVASFCFAADKVDHAIAGTVEKVDSASKTVAVKTADGTVETFKYTDAKTVEGVKAGSHCMVHYSAEGTDKVATGFEDTGKTAWKATKGTVVAVDKAAGTVTVKTKDGATETFHMSEHCMVDTAKGTVKGTDWTAGEVKAGSEVTVHYTAEAGKKVAHFILHPF